MPAHSFTAESGKSKESISTLFRVTTPRYARRMVDEGEDKPVPTVRKTCTIAVATLRRLERLAKRASHGTSASGVMTNFIETGIREAIEKGYIRLEDDE